MNLVAFSENTQTRNPVASALPIERAPANEPVRSFNDYLSHETSSFREEKTVNNDSPRDRRELNDARGTSDYRKESDSAARNNLSGLQSSDTLSNARTESSSEGRKSSRVSDTHAHNTRDDSSVSRKKTSAKDAAHEKSDKTDEPLAALLQILAQLKVGQRGMEKTQTAGNSAVDHTAEHVPGSAIRNRLASIMKKLSNELAQTERKTADAPRTPASDKIRKQLAFAKEISKLIDSGDRGAAGSKNLSSKIESLADRIAAEMKRVKAEDHSGARVQTAAHGVSSQSESRIDITKDMSKTAAADHSISASQGRRGESESSDQQSGSFMKQFGGARDASSSSRTVTQGASSLPFAQKLDELIDKAHITVRDGRNGQLSMRMFPEHLGRVNVTLGLENGVLNAKFLVDSNDARDALTSSLNDLMSTLENEGLSLGAFQVDVRGGDNHSGTDNSGEFISARANRRETEEAHAQYDRRQSATHDGSINLVV